MRRRRRGRNRRRDGFGGPGRLTLKAHFDAPSDSDAGAARAKAGSRTIRSALVVAVAEPLDVGVAPARTTQHSIRDTAGVRAPPRGRSRGRLCDGRARERGGAGSGRSALELIEGVLQPRHVDVCAQLRAIRRRCGRERDDIRRPPASFVDTGRDNCRVVSEPGGPIGASLRSAPDRSTE